MSREDKLAKKRSLLSQEQWAILEQKLKGNPATVLASKVDQEKTALTKASLSSLEPQDALDIDWSSLVEAGCHSARQIPEDLSLADYIAFNQQLDQLCLVSLCVALRGWNIFVQAGERHTVDELMTHLAILPSFRKLLYRWLLELSSAGFLGQEEDTFVSFQPLPVESPVTPFIEEGGLHKKICAAIPSIVTGKKHMLEYIFAEGQADNAEKGYEQIAVSRYFNDIAAKIIATVVEKLPAGRQLRILEIGAGVGGTTSSLLSLLPPDRTVYAFTDLSSYFLDHARKKFANYPFVYYDLLDIDQDPVHAGFQPHSFDMVIGANVMHCARFLPKTLQYMRSLLNSDGLLLLLELTQNAPRHTVFPGLLEGFSHFEDERLQWNKPLLPPVQWEKFLCSGGFKEFAAFPEANHPAEVLGEHVMIAQIAPEILKTS